MARARSRIEALRPGTYIVTFSLAGFSPVRREGIELSGSFIATVNADMRLGSLEETVTVTGASPVVDVQSATRQRVLDSEVISSVPSGRLHTSLAVLIPGVSSNQQDVGGSNIGQFAPSLTIHGSRATDTRFTIGGLSPANGEGGGQSVNYTPNMSSTQEMTIDTSGWSAEEITGGLKINLIPREGGNTFSGTFYAWGANSALQSTNYTPELTARGLGQPDSLVSSYDVNPGLRRTDTSRQVVVLFGRALEQSHEHRRWRVSSQPECRSARPVVVYSRPEQPAWRKQYLLPQRQLCA